MRTALLLAATSALVPAVAHASETTTYSYDVKGRLTQVARSGSVNNGIVAAYAFDRADNRTNLTVTGATVNSPPQRMIVVPMGGLTVIPIPDP